MIIIESFSHLMASQWSLSASNSPRVFWILLSILADPNNAVILMISTHPLISKSSSPCTYPLVTVSRAPITIGITVTFMFHSFFLVLLQNLGIYLSFRFLSGLHFAQQEQQSRLFSRFSFFVDYH